MLVILPHFGFNHMTRIVKNKSFLKRVAETIEMHGNVPASLKMSCFLGYLSEFLILLALDF